MYFKKLPKALERYIEIGIIDRLRGLDHIRSKITARGQDILDQGHNNPGFAYQHFFKFMKVVESDPVLWGTLPRDMITQAAQVLLDNPSFGKLAFPYLLKELGPRADYRSVVTADMIAQAAARALKSESYKSFAHLYESTRAYPEWKEAISPSDVRRALDTMLQKNLYVYPATLIIKTALDDQQGQDVVTAERVTKTANLASDLRENSVFSLLVTAVSTYPHLLDAIKPDARLIFMSKGETGHTHDVLIAFPKEDGRPVELSGGCKHVRGLNILQRHWTGNPARQGIMSQIVGVFKTVANDPHNPSAPIAQQELRKAGLG